MCDGSVVENVLCRFSYKNITFQKAVRRCANSLSAASAGRVFSSKSEWEVITWVCHLLWHLCRRNPGTLSSEASSWLSLASLNNCFVRLCLDFGLVPGFQIRRTLCSELRCPLKDFLPPPAAQSLVSLFLNRLRLQSLRPTTSPLPLR